MNKVKWGFIGAGDVTEVKSGPAFKKAKNSEIISVMRRDVDKAADYASRHGIPHYTSDYKDIINNSEINAVYIATPPSSHAKYCIEAARAGKHVYVEKPMAVDFEECKSMIEVCSKNNVKLFVAYYRRELDYFKKIKHLIDSGAIGKIKFVRIQFLAKTKEDDYSKDNLPWRVIPEISGGGYFFDLASHQFDFLVYLFGSIRSAKGHSASQLKLYSPEDIVTASFEFESGILGNGIWCFTLEGGEERDRTEILGDQGTIEFSFFNTDSITLKTAEKKEEYNIEYPRHVQQQLIERIVNDILGIEKCSSTGLSGARTNWVMEEILS